MTTASSKATAFSLIIRMVLFPVLLWLGSRSDPLGRGRERRPLRPTQHINMCAQFSILKKTENNSSAQSKKAITARRRGVGEAICRQGQLETRPPVQGGGGRWPRLFRCMSGAGPDSDGAGGPSRGEAGQSYRSAGGRQGRFRPVSPATRRLGTAGLERRARHRIAQGAKWYPVPLISNAKTPPPIA